MRCIRQHVAATTGNWMLIFKCALLKWYFYNLESLRLSISRVTHSTEFAEWNYMISTALCRQSQCLEHQEALSWWADMLRQLMWNYTLFYIIDWFKRLACNQMSMFRYTGNGSMRYNNKELAFIAIQPAKFFTKEGPLYMRSSQGSHFLTRRRDGEWRW